VADLGVARVVLAARQMYEIDPYLDIRICPAGLSARMAYRDSRGTSVATHV
jgi:hypothetical protein